MSTIAQTIEARIDDAPVIDIPARTAAMVAMAEDAANLAEITETHNDLFFHFFADGSAMLTSGGNHGPVVCKSIDAAKARALLATLRDDAPWPY